MSPVPLIHEAAHETRLRVTHTRREKFPWPGGEATRGSQGLNTSGRE